MGRAILSLSRETTMVLCVIAGSAAGLGPASAIAASPACPPKLDVVQAPLRLPAGFRAARNGDAPIDDLTRPLAKSLASLQFSDGPPVEMAWLAPDRSAARSQHWDFSPGAGHVVWYSCGYLATDVIISAPLPAATRSCLVTLDPSTSPATPVKLICR